jgi:LAS superfamily LD-carboxypeptidase LdcB
LHALILFIALSFQGDTIPKHELLGQFDPSKHKQFELIRPEHTAKNNIYLRKQAYDAFQAMYDSALTQDIHLEIISATRNFNYQKSIWERKWTKPQYMGWQSMEKVQKIMNYSAMPGTSRHHWGTDIDLNALTDAYFTSGAGLKIYKWLCENAESFGYRQVYTKKDSGRTGYNEEKWHWSFMPLSKKYLEQYKKIVSYEDIEGFSGSESASELEVIDNYVGGIE